MTWNKDLESVLADLETPDEWWAGPAPAPPAAPPMAAPLVVDIHQRMLAQRQDEERRRQAQFGLQLARLEYRDECTFCEQILTTLGQRAWELEQRSSARRVLDGFPAFVGVVGGAVVVGNLMGASSWTKAQRGCLGAVAIGAGICAAEARGSALVERELQTIKKEQQTVQHRRRGARRELRAAEIRAGSWGW